MPTRLVLLTGANTLTGSHILDQLLSRNIFVRAVVGTREQYRALRQQYASRIGNGLDFAIVSPREFSIPGAYDDALQGLPFDTVIHTIPADPFEEADCLSRFINLEIENLITFLSGVNEVAPTVRRVIITTFLSPFARWLVDPYAERGYTHGSSALHRPAETDSEYILATSRASDNIVHDRLWKWLRDARTRFDLVSLTAPSIYGPSMRALNNSTDLEEANRRIWNICSNDFMEDSISPPYGIAYFTDVREFAFAHVQAVLTPEAGNKQFMISAGTMPSRSVIADFLRNRFPEFASRIPPGTSSAYGNPPGNLPLEMIDTTPAAAILGLVTYRPVQQTLTDLSRQILELHRRRDWRRVIQ